MSYSRTADDFDHAHDLRKNWEPEDNRVLGKYTEPKRAAAPIDAIEIAVLVKGMDNIIEAAKLIDQYASAQAAAAKLEEAQHIYDRIDRCLVKP